MQASYRCRAILLASVTIGFSLAQPADASLARKLGRPISDYSASLFGKTNLTSLQTQTLTSDPDQPLAGSTSADYIPGMVSVTGFGFGPGYERMTDSPFPSGFGVEIFQDGSPNGKVMVDLSIYLDSESTAAQTGYLRVFFQIGPDGVASTGKLTNDPTFLAHHPGYLNLDNDGPSDPAETDVDTHYYDFTYREMDPGPATYNVFASDADKHYILGPDGYQQLDTDFVVTQDAPNEQIHPGGAVPFGSASVSGTAVPEPSAGLVVLAGAGMIAGGARRRRCADPRPASAI
jgi:hypothetical protein